MPVELSFKGAPVKEAFTLTVEPTCTVREIKEQCQEKCGLAPEAQRLFLKGKILQDDQTLEGFKLGERATLFLSRGASAGAPAPEASNSTAKPAEEEEEMRVPCAGGCGFFGTKRTDNLCSACYRDRAKKEEDAKKKEAEAKKKEEDEAKAAEAREAAPVEEDKPVQTDPTRCWKCAKKIGLAVVPCKCGYYFCSTHRYAEEHDCTFDHKADGRQILARQNPQLSTGRGLEG